MSKVVNFGSAGGGVYVQLRDLLTSPHYNMHQTVGTAYRKHGMFYRKHPEA